MGDCQYKSYGIRTLAGYERALAEGLNAIDAMFIEHECQNPSVTSVTYDDPANGLDPFAVCEYHQSEVQEENNYYHWKVGH